MKQLNNHKPLIFILYDGIRNSVFAGQVLQPLVEKHKQHPEQPIWLISFEKNKFTKEDFQQYTPANTGIHICVLKKLPFLGTINLYFAARQLKKLLKQFPSYQLIARGPLAGWICANALNEHSCTKLTIQARGLLAEEYAYARKNKNVIANLWHRLRTHQLRSIEKMVYGNYINNNNQNITIEAVSPALKQYLMQAFNTEENKITIAHADIPQAITLEQKKKWRTATRTQLSINPSAHVYCYNGSAKPWQCPEKVVDYFKKEYAKDNRSFLLVLTQEVHSVEQVVQ